MIYKISGFSLPKTMIFKGLLCLGVTGCVSPILYRSENLTIQQSAPNEIIVHRGAKAILSNVEEGSGLSSGVKVFAPTENDQNVAVVRHGSHRTMYKAYAWPINSPSPCVVEKDIESAKRDVDVEWATSVAFSVVDHLNREVHEVVAYDGMVPGWIQISPSSRILRVCPSEGPLVGGEYEAGSMRVIVGRDGKALFVAYNNELYRIALDTPIELPLNGRITVSPNGKIAILAIIDGESTKQVRLFAWSSLKVEPTAHSVSLGSAVEIAVRWLSNRSVSILSKESDLKVFRYNLNRSWTGLDPKQLP